MTVWCLDLIRHREGGVSLVAHCEQTDGFAAERLDSASRSELIRGLRKIMKCMGRPNVIVTDHAREWHGLGATVGARHERHSLRAQAKLTLLERRFRAEDRA